MKELPEGLYLDYTCCTLGFEAHLETSFHLGNVRGMEYALVFRQPPGGTSTPRANKSQQRFEARAIVIDRTRWYCCVYIAQGHETVKVPLARNYAWPKRYSIVWGSFINSR